MIDCTCQEPHTKSKFTDSDLLDVYCNAFEFHLSIRARFVVSGDDFEVRNDEPAPELWQRLAVAASWRKFVSGSDHVYLPKVLLALSNLGAVAISKETLENVRKEFKGLRNGTNGMMSFQIDNQKSFSAFQIVEQLLHTTYLHADTREGIDPWKCSESMLNLALWEGTEQYLPFMRMLYDLSCKAANRAPSELAETLPSWRFKGINDEYSEFDRHVERVERLNPNPFSLEQ
jgi:predicted HicB family RNase H-like nuclease